MVRQYSACIVSVATPVPSVAVTSHSPSWGRAAEKLPSVAVPVTFLSPLTAVTVLPASVCTTTRGSTMLPTAAASAAAPEMVRVLSVSILIALMRSPTALASAGAPLTVRVGSVVTRPSVSLANCSARLADSAAAALELSAASACRVAVSARCVAMPACCSAA